LKIENVQKRERAEGITDKQEKNNRRKIDGKEIDGWTDGWLS